MPEVGKIYSQAIFKIILFFVLINVYGNHSLAEQLSSSNIDKKIKYFILTIDGGGIRGIVPARILQEIEERSGKQIHQLFDFMAGTSTGGLITIALNIPNSQGLAKYTSKDLVELYKNRGKEIFFNTLWWKTKTANGYLGPKYDRSSLDAILDEMIGDNLLSDTLKPIMVSSYSIDLGEIHLWITRDAKIDEKHDFYLKDIAGATTAAPTYFAPKELKNKLGDRIYYEADGGLFANNPVIMALSEAITSNPNIDKNDIMIVSIGTGQTKLHTKYNYLKNAGPVGWMEAGLIDVMMNTSAEVTEWESTILSLDTIRLQVDISDDMGKMDNVSSENLTSLLEITDKYIQENSDKIDLLCRKLLE